MSMLVDQFNRPIGEGYFMSKSISYALRNMALKAFSQPTIWPFTQLVDQFGRSVSSQGGGKTIKFRRYPKFGAIRTEN